MMLDIETLGNGYNACILSIGAIYFDKGSLGKSFYSVVNLHSCKLFGLTTDPGAIDFWESQAEKIPAEYNAYVQAQKPDAWTLTFVLDTFSEFCNVYNKKPERVWGKGSDFDNVVITSAYKATGRKVPWHFRANSCYRTLARLHPNIISDSHVNSIYSDVPGYIKHHALNDAREQAYHAQAILNTPSFAYSW